jgi:hypothetical protein
MVDLTEFGKIFLPFIVDNVADCCNITIRKQL